MVLYLSGTDKVDGIVIITILEHGIHRMPILSERNVAMSAASTCYCLMLWFRRCRQVATLILLVSLISGFASLSRATTNIVDADGFETGFSAGDLEDQSGWKRSTLGTGSSSAVVQGAVTESGAQAVQVDRGALSDDRWALPVTGQGFPNNRYILIDWDMNVTGTGSTAGFGPFFGVDAYRAVSGNAVLGALGVDATTGDVLFQQGGTGFISETGASVTFGQWNHFQMRLDFQADEYSMFLNGSLLLTDDFVDGPATTLTDADIAAFAAAGDAVSQNATGTAYFDNFLVRDVSPADFDINGIVDASDLATLEAAYGSTAGGDADLDGDTDGADFLILQRDYDGAAPLSALVNVPEPSSLGMALLALACISRCNRHR